MATREQQIADFVSAVLADTSKSQAEKAATINAAAAANNVSQAEIAAATGYTQQQVASYLGAPAPTAAPATALAPTPAPAKTTGSDYHLQEVLQSNEPQAFKDLYVAIQSGQAKVVPVTVMGGMYNPSGDFIEEPTTEYAVFDAKGKEIPGVRVDANTGQINLPSAGGLLHVDAQIGPGGTLAPITDFGKQVSYTGGQSFMGGLRESVKELATSPATQILLSAFIPGAGEFLAAELNVSKAVGTALASAAVQVAQGVPLEKAIQNAAINAGVQAGSSSVMTDVVKAGVDPKIANALVSVGGSIAKTALQGGSSADIQKAVEAALAGSGTYSLTDSEALGRLVGGGVQGGTMGAATSLAGYLGGSKSTQPVSNAPISEVVVAPDVQVAGGEGLPEMPKPGLGQLFVDKFGRPISIGVMETDASGNSRLVAAPITGDAKTGYSYQVGGQNVGIPTSQIESLTKTGGLLGGRLDLSQMDFTPIDPKLTPEELKALLGDISEVPFKEIVDTPEFKAKYPEFANVIKSFGTLDAAEGAMGIDALMKIPGIKEAINAPYIRELESALAKDPTYAPFLEEYKRFTGKDYSPAQPTLNLGDLGEIVIQSTKLAAETPAVTPQNVFVYSVDPAAKTALAIDPSGKTVQIDITNNPDVTPNKTVNIDPKTNTIIAPGTVTPTSPTPKTVAPTVSVTPPTTPTPAPVEPATPGPAVPKTPTPTPKEPYTPVQPVDKPEVTVTPPTITTPADTTPTVTPETPTTPKTETKTPPKEKEPLFIYSYLSGPLRSPVVSAGAEKGPVSTVGLTAYRPAGEIESEETGKQRQDVWNEASLRLKDALGL